MIETDGVFTLITGAQINPLLEAIELSSLPVVVLMAANAKLA